MIVEMRMGATQEQLDAVIERARQFGFDVQVNVGTDKFVVAILGSDTGRCPTESFAVLPGVQSVTRIMRPFKLASREFRPDRTVVRAGPVEIGGDDLAIIAGPCSVESREQLMETTAAVVAAGACMLRGGAFKPRTSPFSFQGMGMEGVDLLCEARTAFGVPVVSEVTDAHYIEAMAEHLDVLQIGARNMQNYVLLRAAGETGKPCILKRGLSATVTEWLQAADYLLAAGTGGVILCERGIRTFETSTRFTLDVGAIGVVKRESHLPVIVDPSHAAGHHELVPTLALAAVAAGADGLMIEVHPHPQDALSDGLQSLTPKSFARLMAQISAVAGAVGRGVQQPSGSQLGIG